MLNYETNDPLIMSCVLTNISTLFPFATKREQFLPRVFYKVSQNGVREKVLDAQHDKCENVSGVMSIKV